MRILYIVTAFPRHPGDVITPWLQELIGHLGNVGVEVEVLAPSYRGLPSQQIHGTMVHRFRYAPSLVEMLTHDQTAPDRIRENPLWAAALPGYLVGGSYAATKLARSGRFDLIHAFWPLPHGLLGMAASRASGVPLVSTFFGVELSVAERVPFPFLNVLRYIVRGSDAITAISGFTAGRLSSHVPGAAVDIIPFGAAVSAGAPSAGEERSDNSPFRILFVGRLVERKGVDVLIRALGHLDFAAELKVVGDGPVRDELVEMARLEAPERVEFLGFVPETQLAGQFNHADVVVLPAVRDSKGDEEGLGVVLIEALLRLRPVIASRSGGIPDIVQDGETGLLVEPGDIAQLAEALTRLHADPDLRARLAARGQEHVAEHFSWDRIVRDLSGLYRRVLDRRVVSRNHSEED